MTSFRSAYFTVATNRYVHYWNDMIASANSVFKAEDNVKFIVFTDQEDFCNEIAVMYPNLHISIVAIEPLGWPEATSLRYKIYSQHASQVDAEVFCHIDADMLFFDNPHRLLIPSDWVNGVALVSHPGYFREPSTKLSILQSLKDKARKLWIGGLGTWETKRASTSYVPRKFRTVYVCGGSWMAKKDKFVEMVSQLSLNTEVDYSNGVIAKWHDESHLNHWASKNSFTLLTPSYCFDPLYEWLSTIPEIIRAVRKNT